MYRLGKTIILFGALTLTAAGIPSGAQVGASVGYTGERCYEETVNLANGADPSSLSTAHCTRALRYEPLSRQDRSAVLFNRGIIEKAQGDLVAARQSFEEAVRLSNTVDRRNLALAEVARELGDYSAAMEQYDLLSRSAFVTGSEEVQVAVLERRQQVESAATHYASVDKSRACAGCHGVNGVSGNPDYPTLAGRQEEYIEHALRQFRSGERKNEAMASQVTLITDQDIPVLAGYFASFKGPGMVGVE